MGVAAAALTDQWHTDITFVANPPTGTVLYSRVAPHSGWPPYFERLPDGEAVYRKARADHPPVVHPVIRTHPVTGKKTVYVSPNFTDRIKGLPRQESDALLAFLFARFQRPEFQARLRWEKDTVAVWDNRATVHYGVSDYGDQHRLLHRVTFGEDRAF